jgi:hypothetical protein
LSLTPPDVGPERVRQARAAANALDDQLTGDREAINSAKAALVACEQRDREQLARAMREQREVSSNTEEITAAREALALAERTREARALALADSDRELGEVNLACSGQWLSSEQRSVQRLRARAAKTAERLQGEMTELREAEGIVWWLKHLEQERRVPQPVLGELRGSGRRTANGADILLTDVFSWLSQTISPAPEPQESSQTEPVPAAQ